MSFINDVLNNKAMIEDIDNYVKDWHENNYECELHEFLGLSENQYEKWLQSGDNYLLEVVRKYKTYKENITYWRKNPDKFVEEQLGCKLYPYQKFLLKTILKNKKENK